MLFRMRYYIRIHILYLVRTDVPNWLVSYCCNIKDKFWLKFSDSYLKKDKSYGCVKNGMLYSDNAKFENT